MADREATVPGPTSVGYRRDVRLVLVVWFLLILVVTPFLATGALMIRHFAAQEREIYVGAVTSRAAVISAAVDRRIRAETRLAEVLAATPALVAGDLGVFARWYQSLASGPAARAFVLDRDGVVLLDTSGVAPAGSVAAEAETVRRVASSGDSAVGRLVDHPGGDRPAVFAYVPVRLAGEVRSVFAYEVAGGQILNLLRELLGDQGWFAAVVDGDGRIVARSFRNDDFVGTRANAEFLASTTGASGIVESVDLEGRSVLTGYTRSAASDWMVVVWVPRAVLSASTDRAIWLLLLLPGLTAVVSLVLAMAATRMILKPLRRLHHMAGEIAEGRIARFEPGLLHEANVVGSALAGASVRLAQSHGEVRARSSELQAVNDKLTLALDAAKCGTWELDLKSDRVLWSRENYALFGMDEAAAEPRFDVFVREHVHPDDRRPLKARVMHQIASGSGEVEADYRVIHPDRGIRWISARGRVERAADGTPLRITGLNSDITERKWTEEHIQLLLREVNHRSKNMLAVVQAIARATVTRDPAEFVARFSDRVQALSASQDLLVENDWRGVDLADLARAQLGHYGEAGERVSLEGAPVLLRPVAAQAIGMALHELGTNAAKYGALSGERGHIRIFWTVDGTGPAARMRITWYETGGPPPSGQGRRGFGTTVIETMSRRSLDADVEYRLGPDGVVWTLACAAATAVEPDGEAAAAALGDAGRSAP